MGQYLDDNGLRYLWTKIKNIFVAKESGKGLSSNDFTAAYKSKLDGIANNANNYSLPTASASTLGGIKVGSGLSISNGVLSASGGQSLRVIQEQTGSWVCKYDNDYEVTITIPSSAVLIYVEAGPGDPDWEESSSTSRTKGQLWILAGTRTSSQISNFSYTYDIYYPITKSANVSHIYDGERGTPSNSLIITSKDEDNFYISHYKVLGI